MGAIGIMAVIHKRLFNITEERRFGLPKNTDNKYALFVTLNIAPQS